MEGDFQAVDVAADTGISIHSLRMEGDTIDTQSRKIVLKFQSTPSVWRETIPGTFCVLLQGLFQSTPSVWRETTPYPLSFIIRIFQSTPSVWRETLTAFQPYGIPEISIHSLRMEGDPKTGTALSPHIYFNPLPPYGGRQQNCTGKRFSFRLSLYNPAKKDAKDYILHPKK